MGKNRLLIVCLASFIVSVWLEVGLYDLNNLFSIEFLYSLAYTSLELFPFTAYAFISYYFAEKLAILKSPWRNAIIVYSVNFVLLSFVIGVVVWFDYVNNYAKLDGGFTMYLADFTRFILFVFISTTIQVVWLWKRKF